MAVDLSKLIDFDLLKRYDTNLKNWVEKKIISENNVIFITENSLPNVGDMTVLYVTEDSIQLWNGSEYIKVGGQGTGATFIPSIDKNGDLTWTNNAGLPNPNPVNIMGPQGPAGKDGIIGKDGKSAYEIAKDNGYTGSEIDWLASLKGKDGVDGTSFVIKGMYGTFDELKAAHPTGSDGDAYAVGDENSNVIYNWSEEAQEWQNMGSLAGPPGPKGEDSTVPGPEGKSAYDIAVEGGFNGTEAEWLESLKGANGEQGEDGKSAYELAVAAGYTGTETEWLASLKGDDGAQGVSIKSAQFNELNHLIITLDDADETTIDVGKVNVELAEVTNQEYVNVSLQSSAIEFNGTDYTYVFPTDNQTAAIYVNGVRLKKDTDYTFDESGNVIFTLLYDEGDQCYIEWLDVGQEEDLWATTDDIASLFS